MKAFWELSTERPIGWTTGPIPHSAVLRYGERCELDEAMIDVFLQVIRAMDSGYLKFLSDERERLSKKGSDE